MTKFYVAMGGRGKFKFAKVLLTNGKIPKNAVDGKSFSHYSDAKKFSEEINEEGRE